MYDGSQWGRDLDNVMKKECLHATMFPEGKCKSMKLGHYITPTLDEQKTDVLILSIGNNDLQSRNFNATVLAYDIITNCLHCLKF